MNTKRADVCLERMDEIFQRLGRLLHTELAQSMVDGITMSQFAMLKRLDEKGRATVSAMAEELGVSLSAITALADRLDKMGLLHRFRDEKDRRLVWLSLTDKGESMLSSCRQARMQMIEKYISRLPEEDMDRLVLIYEKILSFIVAEKDKA